MKNIKVSISWLICHFGYSGETKWYICSHDRKQYESFPGGDLISAPIDGIASSKLYSYVLYGYFLYMCPL
jgi:hypothetical protein